MFWMPNNGQDQQEQAAAMFSNGPDPHLIDDQQRHTVTPTTKETLAFTRSPLSGRMIPGGPCGRRSRVVAGPMTPVPAT